MSDFNLSQALEGPLNLEDNGFEGRFFNMTEVQDEIFSIEDGLALLVSRNPKTLRHVAILLLAANRMRRGLSCCVRGLREEELCSAIMDSLVTETTVGTQSSSTTVTRIFHRLNSVTQCTLCDMVQKDVVYSSDELKLQAITLQGGQGERKVNFKMSKYMTLSDGVGQTVVLSIGRDLHMSCSLEDGKATLLLERCDEGELKKISDDGDMDRFLFFKRTEGVSQNSFESVKCRGWLISTSWEEESKPLEMCEVDSANRLTCFKLN
ncbi:interleukin-1 beta [Notothenia coriiceps]|uniref:Interleukin-1 beta n=1 Tax=Notothenia coriiceps TaxID=8208 RepID=A0A6I9NDJ0_9TELE|nr:PREDICTED: interleukin-1 beta-like [Notothenia coriiceps]